jgi:hypothetical protein
MATRRRNTMMATVSALRSPAHRWPRLASFHDSESATGRVLHSALSLKAAAGRRAAPPALDPPADTFEAAVTLYERHRWVGAFDMLARLADRGDAPSSKLALLMLRYGESLYGMRFAARPEQIARWARQVLEATPAAAGPLDKAA